MTENQKQPIRVLISGAAGQIGYALIPLVSSGQMFGFDQPIHLHLVDITPMMRTLSGVVLEIEDCSYPLVHEIIATDSYEIGFKNIDYALLVGGFPRKKGMERSDLLQRNFSIFEKAGKALNQYANKNVKVVVVANPANTNALVLLKNAPSIKKENVSALTRLDMNRATNLLAKKCNLHSKNITNTIIWGNHSNKQVPDANEALIHNKELLSLKLKDESFLNNEFVSLIQNRGAKVIEMRQLSSALSAANAIKDHMRNWVFGTKEGEHVSMAVLSDGNPYGIAPGLIFSFPVSIKNGNWEIVAGIQITEQKKALIKVSEEELISEKNILKL